MVRPPVKSPVRSLWGYNAAMRVIQIAFPAFVTGRADIPQRAVCCRVRLCGRGIRTCTARRSGRVPVPLWLLLLCGNLCTAAMSKRNVQVDVPTFLGHK